MKIENLEYKKDFIKEFYERRKRYFLALEAMTLGHGGIIAVSESFGIDRACSKSQKKELKF